MSDPGRIKTVMAREEAAGMERLSAMMHTFPPNLIATLIQGFVADLDRIRGDLNHEDEQGR